MMAHHAGEGTSSWNMLVRSFAASGDAAERDEAEELARVRAQEKVEAAKNTLQNVMDVNRELHKMLVEKKLHVQELTAQNFKLDRQISSRRLEDPARRAQVAKLEAEVRREQQLQQGGNLELGRQIMESEERVHELAAANTWLREWSVKHRTQLKDQHTEIHRLERKSREMLRHIAFMEGSDVEDRSEAHHAVAANDPRLDAPTRLDTMMTTLRQAQDLFPGDGDSEMGTSLGGDERRSLRSPSPTDLALGFAGATGGAGGGLLGNVSFGRSEELAEASQLYGRKSQLEDLRSQAALKRLQNFKQLPGLDLQTLLGRGSQGAAKPPKQPEKDLGGGGGGYGTGAASQ